MTNKQNKQAERHTTEKRNPYRFHLNTPLYFRDLSTEQQTAFKYDIKALIERNTSGSCGYNTRALRLKEMLEVIEQGDKDIVIGEFYDIENFTIEGEGD